MNESPKKPTLSAEFKASRKEYLKNIVYPTKFKKNNKKFNKLPTVQLELDFVYGFKCQHNNEDVRNMCKYLNDNSRIIFSSGNIGVQMKYCQNQDMNNKEELK